MNTSDFIETLRADIKRELRSEILAELQPEIERRLHANIFSFFEAVAFLKVSETTLRRMVRDNEVPHFYQRTNVYFRQHDLVRWIGRNIKGE